MCWSVPYLINLCDMTLPGIDLHTAYLIVGFLYILLPAFAWLVLLGHRTLQVSLWCGGGLLLGSGLVMVGFREILLLEIFIVVSAGLVLLSALLRIQSLCLDLEKPWRWRWLILTIAI